jgi:pimeloyl-ACP methyl ester carboxylesterase
VTIWVLLALVAIGAVALGAYVLFGGPRLSADVLRIIEEVTESEVPELVEGQTGYASSGSIKLWYVDLSRASPEKGTILLLAGMGGDALIWPRSFVSAFLDAGYRVVRFDQRGTGLSDWIETRQRKDAYTVGELAEDAFAVLDHLKINHAHVCGLSLGGMVAQELAIRHPDRVDSLTLMSTSPDVADRTLPSLSTSYLLSAAWKGLPLLRYRIAGGEKNLIKERIAKTIALGLSPSHDEVRDMAQHVVYDLRKRRGLHLAAMYQHQTAAAISRPRGNLLAHLRVPTLVIHGETDRILPVEHGRRLVSTIPGAQGLWLKDVGHVFPYPGMSEVMTAIFSHLDSATEGAEGAESKEVSSKS